MSCENIQKAATQFYEGCRQEGYRQGSRQRAYLEREGLPMETIDNNQFEGETFHGLYGYLDAMKEGKTPSGDLVECSFCGAEFIQDPGLASVCDCCRDNGALG